MEIRKFKIFSKIRKGNNNTKYRSYFLKVLLPVKKGNDYVRDENGTIKKSSVWCSVKWCEDSKKQLELIAKEKGYEFTSGWLVADKSYIPYWVNENLKVIEYNEKGERVEKYPQILICSVVSYEKFTDKNFDESFDETPDESPDKTSNKTSDDKSLEIDDKNDKSPDKSTDDLPF